MLKRLGLRLTRVAMVALLYATVRPAGAAEGVAHGINLAPVARATTSFVSGHETLAALNDGFTPQNSNDKSHGAYGNWPRTGTQWVQYEWSQPITTRKMEVYWFDDHMGVRLPKACRLSYWDGQGFITVKNPEGLGLAENQFNVTTFPEITTAKIRLEMDGNDKSSTGILDWRVYDTGASPNFAPVVRAGVDRVVVLSGSTYLRGEARDDGKARPSLALGWAKANGPGSVTFADAQSAVTTARFTKPGDYVLRLTADDGQLTAASTLRVTVEPAPPTAHLRPVHTTAYQINSPFWDHRIKNLIINWIPYCARKIADPGLREGGLENFTQAGNKLAGRPHERHVGAPFANAWVYNTVESMCFALLVDARQDAEVLRAQAAMRSTLEDWIPKILGAQEPDGYLQTLYTIGGIPRWSNKADHEGYNAGYFIEAAIAHHLATQGKDRRLYEAARRLADCWCNNIGPAPRKSWYEGHQELEQALAKLARFADETDGSGQGRKYLELAKFLMDSRKNGEEYDQSHLPVIQQYEAVGHAVRAVYSYSAMADLAMETGEVDYHSAVQSIWRNLVQRKYYVTGGVGSGETSEGFGKDYSLPNRAYCESCAGCGELFFQHKMNLAYQGANYADLFEETLFNAILGSVDLQGKNFTYTNPLDSSESRYLWHGCPCCVGNIPRTLLQLPTWMYATDDGGLYVNLYAGSAVTVDPVAKTRVKVEQTTDYPWNGQVALTLHPEISRRFALHLRVPHRNTSALYQGTPSADGLTDLQVNGAPVRAALKNGYAVIQRKWKAGDTITFNLPLVVQRVKSVADIPGNVDRVALRYGPLIYNVESVDQKLDGVLRPSAVLRTAWKPDLLDGVRVIQGEYQDGSPLLAIPNYARLNRGGRSMVWIKDR